MIGWLLNLTYLCLLLVLSPWIVYAAWSKGKYREGWAAKLLGRVVPVAGLPGERVVWFHAVSVGEVKQLDVVLREIQRRRLPWRCVISTTTRTGYDLARKAYPDNAVFYCPLDFTWAVNRAMRLVQPNVLVLTELELWPNLIRAADNHGAAVAIINGRLSERSFRGYLRLRWLIRPLLRKLSLAAIQTAEYVDRFQQLGLPAERTCVTGTLKFDGVQTDRDNAQSLALRSLVRLKPDDSIFVAGSTCDGEEPIVVEAYNRLRQVWPHLRLIIAPRHPERFDSVGRLLSERGLSFERRSQLGNRSAREDARVILVDTIGELSAWWALADVAFVGGSLSSGRGGQNMIEPAAYGVPLCFGPDTRNFQDVVENLLARNAATVVRDCEELVHAVAKVLGDAAAAQASGERAARYVATGRGAAARTVDALESIAPQAHQQSAPLLPAA